MENWALDEVLKTVIISDTQSFKLETVSPLLSV
jgi:hypothetical protein